MLYLGLVLAALLTLCVGTILQPPFLLFSKYTTLNAKTLVGTANTVLCSDPGILNVDFHFSMQTIFWTNYIDGTVNQANCDGSNKVVLVSGLNKPRGLAVNWIDNTVYYSYADPGSSVPENLAVYDLAIGDIKVISPGRSSRIEKYYELAVDPHEGMLYWTTAAELYSSTLSGEDVQLVHDPQCLVLYLSLVYGILYFPQDGCSSRPEEGIRSYNLATDEVTSIHTGPGSYRGVSRYRDTIYWAEHNAIFSAPATGGGSPSTVCTESGGSLRGLTVFDSSLQPLVQP